MEGRFPSLAIAVLSTICVTLDRWPNAIQIQFTHLKNGGKLWRVINCGWEMFNDVLKVIKSGFGLKSY